MTFLNFDANDPRPKGDKKSLKIVMAIGAIAGVLVLRSTFAANISLNADTPVEFGQGVAQTTACDDHITITPFSTFVNATGAGAHMFTSLKISGIDSSSDKCAGKTFVIKAYGDSGLLDLFNYSEIYNSDPPQTLEDHDYNSIEIFDNAGEFIWQSGGTDTDDITNDENVGDPGRDLTNTSFTLSLTSITTTITRTPLALATDVKNITVETYDRNLLSNRILTSSQFGIYIPANVLDEGLATALGGPLPGGNYAGIECIEPDCFGYTTFNEVINDLTERDLENLNSGYGSNLTIPQIKDSVSIKFIYNPNAAGGFRWSLIQMLNGGQISSPVEGNIIGFNGTTGIFQEGMVVIFFSLDRSLTNSSVIGTFTPYGDHPERTLPIRNFRNLWNGTFDSYSE
jgi:hypothetical protein